MPTVPGEPPPARPGYYRVAWYADLPKDECGSPGDAAEVGRLLAAGACADCDGIVNVFAVTDGDTGETTEHDLAG